MAPLTVGLRMCATPAGTVAGILVIGRLTRPDGRLKMIGALGVTAATVLAAEWARHRSLVAGLARAQQSTGSGQRDAAGQAREWRWRGLVRQSSRTTAPIARPHR